MHARSEPLFVGGASRLAAEHEAPLVCGATQCPADEQKVLVEQSAFERQEVLQDVAPQT